MTTHRYEVQIVNPATCRAKVWGYYDSREIAEAEAAKLRKHQFFVQVRRIDDEPEAEAIAQELRRHGFDASAIDTREAT